MKKLIFTLIAIAITAVSFGQTSASVNKNIVFDLFSSNTKVKAKAYKECQKYTSLNFTAVANGASDISVMPKEEKGFSNYYENHLKNLPEHDSISTKIEEGSAWTQEEKELGVTLYKVFLYKNGEQIVFYSFCWIGNQLKSVMDPTIN